MSNTKFHSLAWSAINLTECTHTLGWIHKIGSNWRWHLYLQYITHVSSFIVCDAYCHRIGVGALYIRPLFHSLNHIITISVQHGTVHLTMTSSNGNISALLDICEGNSAICSWTNGWANHLDAGDLRRHGTHYDVNVMYQAVCQADL